MIDENNIEEDILENAEFPEEQDDKKIYDAITEISEFTDDTVFNKIINKLTDYAEILNVKKISSIINYNYKLSMSQINMVINLLTEIQAITKIYNIALKGSKDLEAEYTSNIFSDTTHPENISSYLSLRNQVENRLNHQIQQYNMNMGKTNAATAMPLNELRGHLKTYTDLNADSLSVSAKAQHGMIAVSLHDAYIILMNQAGYANNKTYMKFFFNDSSTKNMGQLLVSKNQRLSLDEIKNNIEVVLNRFTEITNSQEASKDHEPVKEDFNAEEIAPKIQMALPQNDRMLMTPFGKQYGTKIDSILNEIFSSTENSENNDDLYISIKDKTVSLYELFNNAESITEYREDINEVIDYLLMQNYDIKVFAEKLLYINKKEPFSKFYSGENKNNIVQFLSQIFTVYFNDKFSPIFRIIKSLDLRKFACAFIMKRIYLTHGENITNFGFFFIKTVAKEGGIKTD